MALNENTSTTPRGASINAGLLDYRCLGRLRLQIDRAVLIEVPNPENPDGAKGVGEVNICRRWGESPTRSKARRREEDEVPSRRQRCAAAIGNAASPREAAD